MTEPNETTKPEASTEVEASAVDGLVMSISTQLAKALLSCGDFPGNKCRRIQFKGGKWPKETNNGGMRESALRDFFFDRLKEYFSS